MKTLLSVRNLRVEIPTRRATLVALDDVSFNIDEGEVLGVVGESGAGKSITGSAVIGLIDPPRRVAGGEILFARRRIDNPAPDAVPHLRGRELGPGFQDPPQSSTPLPPLGHPPLQPIPPHP